MEAAKSRETAAKELPPECAERQARAMPARTDVIPARMESSLYPNWTRKLSTKPMGGDCPRPYQMPRDDANRGLLLEDELGANSVFDPLASSSQSSQLLNPQPSLTPDMTTGVAGPKTPPHFCEAPTSIPQFNFALLGVPALMAPVMDGENALLNLVPGSLVKHTTSPELGRGMRGSGAISCSKRSMSLGSPAVSSSLTIALKVCAWAAMPALFDESLLEEDSDGEEGNEEEEMDATVDSAKGED